LLDSASDKVVVGMLSQRGLGDDMPRQFHDSILTFSPSNGKPVNEREKAAASLLASSPTSA
jgi:hypothetical protein